MTKTEKSELRKTIRRAKRVAERLNLIALLDDAATQTGVSRSTIRCWGDKGYIDLIYWNRRRVCIPSQVLLVKENPPTVGRPKGVKGE